MDQFSQLLETAGPAANITLTSIAPVTGYTLEAQLRELSGLPAINNEPPASPPSGAMQPPSARHVL